MHYFQMEKIILKEIIILIVYINFLFIQNVTGDLFYCKKYLFQRSFITKKTVFTRELSNMEYVNVGQFKTINCCAKNYHTIQWYKDDKLYPWSNKNDTTFKLFTFTNNQTIFTNAASHIDNGNYRCVVRGPKRTLIYKIELNVFEENFDFPIVTYEPSSIKQYVNVNSYFHYRSYCEIFYGDLEIANDYAQKLAWYIFTDLNKKFQKINAKYQHTIKRDDGNVIGVILTIPRRLLKYGSYIFVCDVKHAVENNYLSLQIQINVFPRFSKNDITKYYSWFV